MIKKPKNPPMKKRNLLVAFFALFVSAFVFAQSNQKPLRIIVTFTAGGPVDFVARTIAEPLSKELGRTVLVENRPGGNGAIGAAEIMRAEPDGSMVWLSSVGAVAINQALYEKLAYDMNRDFAPVSLVVNNVELLVVNQNNPAKDAGDFVTKAKSQKDPTPIASSGTGSIPHLALLQLQDSTKVDFIHVPYTGMSQALTDVMGGQVAGVFADVPAVMGQVKSGRLKPMGIASKNRHPGLPDVKTFEELGIKAVDTNNWYGLFVSSKTPRQLIDQINKAIKNVLLDPATSNKLLQSGAEPKSSTPEELGAILKADADKWSTLIKVKNIKANL
jgi:tripartite-type tricarboxylate transporter receptor subunit TctC